MDIDVKSFPDSSSPLQIAPVTINPLTIAGVEHVQPVAVHLKEVNQIDPLVIDSVRLDRVANLDPLQVERLNVTRLPMVNLAVQQVPEVSITVGRVPPVAISIQQSFELTSDYTARARVLGLAVFEVRLNGVTRAVPRDCVRREQAHTHERSFPEVAPAGNPAIPSRLEERYAVSSPRLGCGPPRFSFHARRAGG